MANKLVVGIVSIAGVVVVGAIGTAIYLGNTYEHVQNGYVGIVKHMDGSLTELPTGWHHVGWTASMEQYPVYLQGTKYQLTVGTADSQKMPMQVNINWQLNTKDADTVYRMVGSQGISYVQSNIVDQKVQGIVNQVTHQYDWNDLLGKSMPEATKQIQEQLAPALAADGITLDSLYIGEVSAPGGMVQAQQQVAQAELLKQTAQAQLDAQLITNKKILAAAETQAQADKIQAAGTAAKAKALNQWVIEEDWIDAWKQGGSHVPTTIFGQNGTTGNPFMFNFQPPASNSGN